MRLSSSLFTQRNLFLSLYFAEYFADRPTFVLFLTEWRIEKMSLRSGVTSHENWWQGRLITRLSKFSAPVLDIYRKFKNKYRRTYEKHEVHSVIQQLAIYILESIYWTCLYNQSSVVCTEFTWPGQESK